METRNTTYMPDLDVLRALAAISVFIWHYIHFQKLIPEEAYVPGLALLEEGHIGVSLFMVLSGLLFFKITFGKSVDWRSFAWNRFVRIVPLLAMTQILWLMVGALGITSYSWIDLIKGFALPVWTGGAWSIAVEIHFYLLLPLILWAVATEPRRLIWLLGAWIIIVALADIAPEIRYLTILGRLDQFLIGGLLYVYMGKIPRSIAALVLLGFLIYLELFNFGGGHAAFIQGTNSIFASDFPRWTIEGIGFASIIILFDKSDWAIKNSRAWRFFAWVGQISYSVYLLHFFLLLFWFYAMDKLGISSMIKLALIFPCMAVLLLVSSASFKLIETRFLRRRVKYIQELAKSK